MRNQIKHVIFLLTVTFCVPFYSYAQTSYNNCYNAFAYCPNQLVTLNNILANKTVCSGCADDFSFCFVPNNTIWVTFTTNSTGGTIQADFTNLIFETSADQDTELQATILEAGFPCNSSSYIQLGNCEMNATGDFSLIANGLAPNTVYYIVIDGDLNGPGITKAAECTFDLQLSGVAIDRQPPTIDVSSINSSICKNDLVIFSVSTTNCPISDSFQWYLNDTLVAVTADSTFQTTELKEGDLLKVETACYIQCPEIIQSGFGPVSVYSFPLDAGMDQHIKAGEKVPLNGSTSSSFHTWTPSFLVGDPNALITSAFPTQTTVFTLTAIENNCTLNDYITITVDPALEFPNTFSPNGDNINDTWEIIGIEIFPNCLIQIFDRWGQEVYQTTGYSAAKSWNGTSQGLKLAASVYFYVIDLRDSQKQTFKGSITLIR
jgi:gliding motility-associated-like protein